MKAPVVNPSLLRKVKSALPYLTPEERYQLDQALNTQVPPFDTRWLRSTAPPSWNWDWPHLRVAQRVLQRVFDGELRFVMFFEPPRHGKSQQNTIRFPAYWLQHRPHHHVIIGAYNQLLANKFSRGVRRLAQGRFALSNDRTAADDWETMLGGGIRAVGVGSGVTGHGGDLICIDDPVKSREEAESEQYRERLWDWYRDDLYTRLEPGGAISLTMTRWHEDDLAGRILNSPDAQAWTVISLPALAEVDV